MNIGASEYAKLIRSADQFLHHVSPDQALIKIAGAVSADMFENAIPERLAFKGIHA